jgi:hypothetical protein
MLRRWQIYLIGTSLYFVSSIFISKLFFNENIYFLVFLSLLWALTTGAVIVRDQAEQKHNLQQKQEPEQPEQIVIIEEKQTINNGLSESGLDSGQQKRPQHRPAIDDEEAIRLILEERKSYSQAFDILHPPFENPKDDLDRKTGFEKWRTRVSKKVTRENNKFSP